MLVKTYDAFLVGQKYNKSKKQLNTLKVDFSKMSFTQGFFNKYIQCETQTCKSILTQIDKNHDYVKINTPREGLSIWLCRFCKKQNIIQGELYFAPMKYKYVLQKNLCTRIAPPILLFLIDHSGSMGQSIMFSGKQSPKRKFKKQIEVKSNSKMYKLVKESKLYHRQKQKLKVMKEKWGCEIQQKQQEQTVSKIQFLYAMIEHSLKQLKNKPNSSHYRVGFIFFNKFIYLMKGSKQKTIPMLVNKNDKVKQQWPLQKHQLNFYNIKQLFAKGKQYDRFFGDSKVSNLDTSKINVDCLQCQGQTSFGPALALALGIVSQHDYGSKIIAVTDSQPNYGVLSLQNNSTQYKFISQQLKQNKCMLNVLRWNNVQQIQYLLNQNSKQYEYQKQFRAFCEENSQFVKIRQVNLDKLVQLDKIQKNMQFVMNLVNTNPIGNSLQIHLLNDNPRIKFEKFQFDKSDYRKLRFINSSSKSFIQTIIDFKKLQQLDFVFPSVTQMITIYDDVFKKQRCIFMSSVIHKLIKDTIVQQDFQNLNGINTNNIQSLIDLQNIQKYKQMYRGTRTFKQQYKSCMLKINDIQIDDSDCSSINDLSNLQNRLQLQDDNQKQTI